MLTDKHTPGRTRERQPAKPKPKHQSGQAGHLPASAFPPHSGLCAGSSHGQQPLGFTAQVRRRPAPIRYSFPSALALLQLALPHFSQPTSVPLQLSSDRARVMDVPAKPCMPAAAPATHGRWRGMLTSTELGRDGRKCQSSFYL